MRRPWIESGALLAFTHPTGTRPLKPEHPFTRSLRMADFAPFAFLSRLDGVAKPRIVSNATALARHVESLRHGQAIELVDVEDIEVPGKSDLYTGVQIFTLSLDGGRDRCLGYAWLNGHGRERLEPALRAVRRNTGRKSAA